MGLSDDQRAMLRMVAQRGEQGYEDIAALMGLSVDEVRAKVAAALAELDEEGALAAGNAPEAEAPAAKPAPETDKPAPAEPAPVAAKAPAPDPAPAPKAPRSPRSRPPRISMPRGQVLWAAIAGGVIIVALIVIAILVSNGGSDDESANAAPNTTTTASSATGKSGSTNAKEVTKAILKPVDGSKAEGVVVFGKVKKSLALEIAAENLQPTGSGEEYSIWLSSSPQKMLPLASVKAPKGRIAAQVLVPAEVLGYLADETFTEIALTRTDDATLNAALKKAVKEKQSTPDYTGTEALRGPVTGPIVGAAQRLEEIEAEKKGE